MRAALDGLNDSLRPRLGVELEARIGIATGEALVSGGGDALATGDVMNTAARLEQGADPGEILVGRETMLLSRDAITYGSARLLEARGKREPIEVWAADGVAPTTGRVRAALVGREPELQCLAGAVEDAIRGDGTRVVVVLGEPGIGKTRVAEAFGERVAGRASVHRGACLPYGEGTAWLPLAQVVRGDLGVSSGDAADVALAALRERLARRHPAAEAAAVEAQLAPLLDVVRTPVASGAELLWAVRRYLEALASETPTVVVLDDLHWASENLLELVQELVETIVAVPLVLICQGRPELREHLAGVVSSERAQTLELGPLSTEDARQLADTLDVGEAGVQRADGNPLFLEELAMASEEPEPGAIPHSLRALIGARLDRLPPDSKRAAQMAAVVGDVFWDAVVSSLPGEPVSGSAFRVLRTRGLIDEEPSSRFVGARQFRFHHALIRDVAYESVSKQQRGALHQAVAAWLEERADEHADLGVSIAHHLDRAVSLASDIAPLEAPDPVLVESAVKAQWRAGDWADANAAQAESLRFAGRGAALAETSTDLRARSRARLANALAVAGLQDEGQAAAEDVLRSEPSDEATAYATLALAQIARDRNDPAAIRLHAEQALALAHAGGLDALEVSVLSVLGWAEMADQRHAEGEQLMERAAGICLRRGDLAVAARATAVAGVHALWRGALDQAEARAAVAVRYAERSGSLVARAHAQSLLAHLRREQGRLDEAVEHGRERLRLELEVGDAFRTVGAYTLTLAYPLILLGRLDEAWDLLERAHDLAGDFGARWFNDVIHADRAWILRLQGRLADAQAEAERGAGQAEGVDRSRDSTEQLAELHAAHGRHGDAEALWRTLMECPWGDGVLAVGHVKIGFARFLAARGRSNEAAALVSEVRSGIEGSGAGLLEGQVAAVEEQLGRGEPAAPYG
jgi:tetratricopeptide (TPR) repeat protein